MHQTTRQRPLLDRIRREIVKGTARVRAHRARRAELRRRCEHLDVVRVVAIISLAAELQDAFAAICVHVAQDLGVSTLHNSNNAEPTARGS